MQENILDRLISIKEYNLVDIAYTEDATPSSFDKFENWVSESLNEPLGYLADHRKDLRSDIRNFFPEFESALVFLFSYKHAQTALEKIYKDKDSNGLKIASYTFGFNGLDYHQRIKEILEQISSELKKEIPDLTCLNSLDVHPVLERDLAFRSGLGFFGKNSMMINTRHGSFFIIGALLLNKKLNLPKRKIEFDHCGTCTKCADSCPTNAIDPISRTIIAKDCISTFTIEEFKASSTPSIKMDLSSGYIFGCDICQNVCPWNTRLDRNMSPNQNPFQFSSGDELKIVNFFLKKDVHEVLDLLKAMSNSGFKKYFLGTSFFRSGKQGILKNFYYFLTRK
jgi:epoxyqueuosine reductase